ncbi:regulatory protein, luxR family [Goodfellowiella coeruleoviolacea]|uniref:Regulatory protein, luxR family n=2 Tax=Goodfellowiella coeruleoviolacea TaxID=334858 RepID=A0AAE3GMT1_9PSEU|nr:regulatory protein, luxR family [Goodfellowiella coeruleoviolacea]
MRVSDRQDKVELLQDFFAAGSSGTGSIVAVQGPMATGKTSLLHDFAEQLVGRGVLVLTATASPEEQDDPLGVIRQLVRHIPAPAVGDGAGHPADELVPDAADADAVRLSGLAMLELTTSRPVAIVVDDAQHCDEASLNCLLFMVRRLRSNRLQIVVGVGDPIAATYQRYDAAISRGPRFHRIRLTPLAEAEVASALHEHLGGAAARDLGPAFHRISGGNLRLLSALIHDTATAAVRDGAAPAVGNAFREAVSACLHCCDRTMFDLIRVMAVLGEQRTSRFAGALLGLADTAVVGATRALEAAGLLGDGWFRHPAVRSVVLASLSGTERAEIHQRAAALLHQAGAELTVVAKHLVAAGFPLECWGVQVLSRIAEEEARHGRTGGAIQFLTSADRLAGTGRDRAALRATLASVEWRTSPLAVERHLPRLIAAQQDGELTTKDSVMVISQLVCRGWLDEAETALRRLVAEAPSQDPGRRALLNLLRQWLTYWCPTLLSRVPESQAVLPAQATPAVLAATPRMYAGEVIDCLLGNGTKTQVRAGADHILRSCALDDSTFEPLLTALLALVSVDRHTIAGTWCDTLLQQAAEQNAVTWQAELLSARALIALRAGDLAAAVQCAKSALDHVDVEKWGTRVGIPLGSLVLAYTAMGLHDAAAAVLDQPVPTEMFQVQAGLHYWRARGHYFLATGRLRAAQNDFSACGELTVDWELDRPGVLAWRNDLGQLYLRQGRLDLVRSVAGAQLARAGDDPSSVRGVALRLLAATAEPEERLELLEESAEVLDECAARLELTYTLSDLAHVHDELGYSEKAETVGRQAWQLAKVCGVALEFKPRQVLTDAEMRVATLAARGLTNREISRSLYITVSTVEQHLTKAYRKLKVSRRADLPARLEPVVIESA